MDTHSPYQIMQMLVAWIRGKGKMDNGIRLLEPLKFGSGLSRR
jgi:hypothetical protein